VTHIVLLFSLAVGVASIDPPGSAKELTLPDLIASRYADNDPAGLERLWSQAQSTSDDLLLRYRLYPLVREHHIIKDLPADYECRSAKDYALLSALWSYRVTAAPVWHLIGYARRSDALLARAIELDRNDPFVLLVEGQNLFYRPGIVGGSATEALDRFTRLRDQLRRLEADGRHVPGLPAIEAEIWVWYTLRALDRSGTEALRERLLATRPAPLYEAFLRDPP